MSEQRLQKARDFLLRAVESLGGGEHEAPEGELAGSNNSEGGNRRSFLQPESSRINTVVGERNRLFNFSSAGRKQKRALPPKSKKKRLSTWTHDFVCLAKTNRSRPPTSMEAGELLRAGLGRKQLSMIEDGDSREVHTEILDAFPKLRYGGGYELLRVGDGGGERNKLKLIVSPPEGYCVSYLKEVLRQAKVYIRPLQKDLPLEPVVTDGACEGCPKETCIECGLAFPLPQLKEHIDKCGYPGSDQTTDDEDFPIVDLSKHSESESDVEQDILDHVLAESRRMGPEPVGESSSSYSITEREPLARSSDLEDAISILKSQVVTKTIKFEVDRSNVMESLLRECRKKTFQPLLKVKTWFIGEDGYDAGGLTKEMWRLFGHELKMKCNGKPTRKIPRHDAAGLQEGAFRRIGILMGMSFAQGGAGFPFFSPCVFEYFCGKDVGEIMINRDEIPDTQIIDLLQKILAVGEDVCQLREVAMDGCDILLNCGFNKPLANLSFQDVPQLVECVTLHSTILIVKAELDQIIQGLEDSRALQIIRGATESFRKMFVDVSPPLTAAIVMELFNSKVFSSYGSSEYMKEKKTYLHFRKLLETIEDDPGGIGIDLGNCLSFFTGYDRIPPLGFEKPCVLTFSGEDAEYPTASLCSLTLILPTKYHDDFDLFKTKILFGFINHGGFGLC